MSSNDSPLIFPTFLSLDPEVHSYQNASIVVLPIPYDNTASFKTGARDGPDAIITASKELEEYDLELGYEPACIGIHTASALEPHMGSPENMSGRITNAVKPVVNSRKVPAILGGDHSVTVGAVRAMKLVHSDLSVLYLDAHADYREDYLGTRWGHASTAKRVAELCPVTLVGVRSMSGEEAHAIHNSSTQMFHVNGDYIYDSWDPVIASLSSHVYISVDLDVFDPSFMSAVGTPEPGGLGWYSTLRLLRQVGERCHIVGFDVVELTPREGPTSCAYVAAKLVYKLIGYTAILNPQTQ